MTQFDARVSGWSMNDEATTHYSAIIDNMAFGFKTLHDIFGSNDSLCALLQLLKCPLPARNV
jgi:hypothetical protein